MDIRYNINRIHSNLSDKYGDVQITEKSSLKFGKYFEIVVNESKVLKMILPFKNIDNQQNFELYYYSNPVLESSDLITRNANAESVIGITEDIFKNNRFSEDYIKS
jgi:hypothetical protein